MAFRLRMLLPPDDSPKFLNANLCDCGDLVEHDDSPFHAIDCRSAQSQSLNKQRHDLVRDALAGYLKSTVVAQGCTVTTEMVVWQRVWAAVGNGGVGAVTARAITAAGDGEEGNVAVVGVSGTGGVTDLHRQ